MGNPYLNSGESLIQTTDRISVNSVSSDLLLTTRRLVLVDSTHPQSEPIQIPFTAIMSLRGGWNTDGDPIITLTLTDAGDPDSTYPLDLVFSQQAGEHRKEECDGWVEYPDGSDQYWHARRLSVPIQPPLIRSREFGHRSAAGLLPI